MDEKKLPNELWKALLALQGEKVDLQRTGKNPAFKSKFVPLEELVNKMRPLLTKHGLVLTQLPTVEDGQPALQTSVAHAESGEVLSTTMLLQIAKDDPQGQGSALTYARRYAIMSMFGLIAEDDDDGNRASQPRAVEKVSAAKATEVTQAVTTAGWDAQDVWLTATRKYGRTISSAKDLTPLEANEIIEGAKAAAKT